MRMSKAFGKTLREAPTDAEMVSHQLLIRANYIRPLASGIYTFMPLGYRVIRKIWDIMAQEMDEARVVPDAENTIPDTIDGNILPGDAASE